jgi:hypothetical protein
VADQRTAGYCLPACCAKVALSQGQAGTGLSRYFERNVSSHTTYDLSGALSVMTSGGEDVGEAIGGALARDWAAQGPRVCAAGPGLARGDISRLLGAQRKRAARYWSAVPKSRVAEPEEMAGAVLFLSCRAPDLVTAQSTYVNGGYLGT